MGDGDNVVGESGAVGGFFYDVCEWCDEVFEGGGAEGYVVILVVVVAGVVEVAFEEGFAAL